MQKHRIHDTGVNHTLCTESLSVSDSGQTTHLVQVIQISCLWTSHKDGVEKLLAVGSLIVSNMEPDSSSKEKSFIHG